MTAYKCKRCRNEIEPGKHSKGKQELIGSRIGKIEWDICEACDVELRRFMGGAKLVEIR